MGYGAHYVLATDGDENGLWWDPQTTEVDDVWQLKPPANMARNAWEQMSDAPAERREAR
jgi:hypothetical protein